MQTFPYISQFVDKAGKIIQPFISYLQQFTIAPPAFASVIVGSSPFSYTAKEPGNLYISGGTVSAITLTRGNDTITLSTTRPLLIPVAIEDTVLITYTVLPNLKFIPSYGQNTTN